MFQRLGFGRAGVVLFCASPGCIGVVEQSIPSIDSPNKCSGPIPFALLFVLHLLSRNLMGEGTNLLNVVVAQRAPILKLLSREDQTLLVGGDAFFVLNLALDIVDRVARLNFERNGLARKGLDEAKEEVSRLLDGGVVW